MGSGDVILCTDHPILGQAVIVLHLDYPNCYESQDAFSSGHVECTSLPHRSDVFECSPHFYEHWNFGPIHSHISILAPSFQTLEFRPYFYKHWNSTPSFQRLEFCPYSFKHWNFVPVISKIWIPALSFQTLELWPYFYKHWNSYLILTNLIPALSFQTLEFLPCFYKHWNSSPIR